MRLLKSLILLFALVLTPSAFGRDLTESEKLSDLDQMVARIKSGYGPLYYKKSQFGIDVDQLRAKYAARISQTSSNGEFYYEINQFIAEFKDGHFSARVPTTHMAALPFTVDWIEGKVLIDFPIKK
jgi:hypothetical protein